MAFLGPWLTLVGCTIAALIFQAIAGRHLVSFLPALPMLGLELGAFCLWATYWVWLYPTYFTPFRHLPTPPKRWFLKGNRDEFFPANPWFNLLEMVRSVPNNGLIRYYGPTNLERILITSAEGLRDALVVNAFDFDHESLVKLATKRFTGSELAELTNDEFKAHKKHLQPAFTVPHTRALAPRFFNTAVRMVHAIERDLRRDPSAPIPLHEFINRATLDNIGLAGMGYNFGTLENPDSEDLAMFHKLCVETTTFFNWVELMSHYIEFHWLLHVPLKKNLEVLEGAIYLRKLARRVIDEKKARLFSGEAEESEKKDIVSVALASGAIEPGIMVDHVMTLIQGGQESTAATYQWAMYELARRPEMQRRLRAEIREHLSPSLEATSGANICNLPFLSAVCNETLRFYPYMPIMLKECVKDSVIVGEHIPKKTIIVYSAYTINREEKLWGPDAGVFDPERWMAPGMSKTGGATTNYALTTFGHGPRGCVGQNFARVFLPCLIAAVIGRYEIELTPDSNEGRTKFGLRNIPDGMWAKLTPIEGW